MSIARNGEARSMCLLTACRVAPGELKCADSLIPCRHVQLHCGADRDVPHDWHVHCRGEVSDYVMMEGRGFGFVTYKDPTSAQRFLEVWLSSPDGAPAAWMHFIYA